MKLLAFWLATATMFAVGGYVALDRHADQPQVEDRPNGKGAPDILTTDTSTRSDVETLRREVALLKSELAAGRAASVAGTRGAQMPLPENRPTETGSFADTDRELQFQHHLTEIGAQFTREGLDQRWANETGITLEDVLASEDLKTLTVRNIDCRTKTCRIEVEDDGAGTTLGALPFLAMHMADTLPNIVSQRVDQPDGRATVVLYMSRE